MTNEIKKLMIELLKNQEIVESWGTHDIQIADDSVSFSVSGFNYVGQLTISVRTAGYNICGKGLNIDIESEDVYKMVEILDRAIETSDKYISELVEYITNMIKGIAKPINPMQFRGFDSLKGK